MSLFYFSREITARSSLRGKGGGNEREPHHGRPPLALSKEVSFTVTMILVNGP